jgi:hypothetical protein
MSADPANQQVRALLISTRVHTARHAWGFGIYLPSEMPPFLRRIEDLQCFEVYLTPSGDCIIYPLKHP